MFFLGKLKFDVGVAKPSGPRQERYHESIIINLKGQYERYNRSIHHIPLLQAISIHVLLIDLWGQII